MRTKEEYYELVKQNRKIASDPEFLKCPCPNVKCEWHGKCKECVAIHRFHKNHLPNCLKPLIKDELEELARAAEMELVKKQQTPDEYRDRVVQQDRKKSNC